MASIYVQEIHKQWKEQQGEYYKIRGSRKSERQCTIQLIEQLWKETIKIWTTRSEYAHSEESVWYIKERNETRLLVEKEYRRGAEGAKGADKRWWKINITKLTTSTHASQKKWLESVKNVRKKVEQEKPRQTKIISWIRNSSTFS